MASSKKVRAALEHKDEYGAGAKARRAAHLSDSEEYEAIEKERKRGTLHAGGSGKVVRDPQMAKAIAASEIRRKNADGDLHGGQY